MQRISRKKPSRGFTLLEVLVAMGVGLLLLAGAIELYRKGLDATFFASQRSEMQLDVRAAQNLLIKDISMAGAGLDPGGVAVATGASESPIYGCDQTQCYLPVGSAPSGIAFPSNPGPYIYWIMPGHDWGATVNAASGPTDAITVVYGDTTFPWDDYSVSFNNTSGTSVKFTQLGSLPSLPLVKISDPANGLQTGDLVLFTNTAGGNTQSTVGEVTATATGTSSPYNVSFSDPDALGLNQGSATSSGLPQITAGTGTTAIRIYVITYYIYVRPNPSGSGPGTPVLMRQVNGHSPVPVAENIVDLHFWYDLYDDNGNLTANQTDASGSSPNMIRKIRVSITGRSEVKGTTAYQSINLRSIVSASNMSFKDRYPQK